MDKLNTQLRTWFLSVRWPTPWRSPKGDGATANAGPVPVGYLVNHPGGCLLIGCADNAAARRAMAECLPGDPRRWLIDAGNDTNWGLVLVGNVADRDFGDEQAFVDQTCYLLPAPTVQRPDLLTAVSTRPPDMDCAAALDLTDQDPTINQIMASLALQVVCRMVAGTCPFMGLYLDMEQGTVTPSYVTPEAVVRLVRSDSQPSR